MAWKTESDTRYPVTVAEDQSEDSDQGRRRLHTTSAHSRITIATCRLKSFFLLDSTSLLHPLLYSYSYIYC
ncbi:hypothetical protein DICVIV_12968 [Dictyocaulus viviparus]|uniref:Uncharacterized protein n=1 Tax=Dictyocaulus viviparus TaxID=29172 RepID=A0A0D8XBB9_DICVI|nr:hypothetical protein DICVIV_12968 [Dictyocaulus viviparus]